MRRLLLVPVVLAVLVPALPAQALSCVGHPGLTPAGLVDGTAVRQDGTSLLAGFDGVLLGRAAVVPDRDPSGAAGPVEVEVEVLLSSTPLPARVVVGSDDPSWGPWQPFDRGLTYVVPYRLDGDRLTSELCEPVLGVRADALPALAALAEAQGWVPPQDEGPAATGPATGSPTEPPTGSPTESPTPPLTEGTATTTPDPPADDAAPLLGGLAVLLAAAAGGAHRLRRRP